MKLSFTVLLILVVALLCTSADAMTKQQARQQTQSATSNPVALGPGSAKGSRPINIQGLRISATANQDSTYNNNRVSLFMGKPYLGVMLDDFSDGEAMSTWYYAVLSMASYYGSRLPSGLTQLVVTDIMPRNSICTQPCVRLTYQDYATGTAPIPGDANGNSVNYYETAAAQAFINAGLGNAILRVSHEMTAGFSFQAPSYSDPTNSPTQYIAAWQNVHNQWMNAKGTCCGHVGEAARFEWDFNPMYGVQEWTPYQLYPGDAYVDYVGPDLYFDRYFGTDLSTSQIWKNEMYLDDVSYGMRWWEGFARQHNKKLAIPELGSGWKPGGHGSGDSPGFYDYILPWAARNHVSWIGLWSISTPQDYQARWSCSSNVLNSALVSTLGATSSCNKTNQIPALFYDEMPGEASNLLHFLGSRGVNDLGRGSLETHAPFGLTFTPVSQYAYGSNGLYIPQGTPSGTVVGTISAAAGERIHYLSEDSSDSSGYGNVGTQFGVNYQTGVVSTSASGANIYYYTNAVAKFSARNDLGGQTLNVPVYSQGRSPPLPPTASFGIYDQPADGSLAGAVITQAGYSSYSTADATPCPTASLSGPDAAYFTVSVNCPSGSSSYIASTHGTITASISTAIGSASHHAYASRTTESVTLNESSAIGGTSAPNSTPVVVSTAITVNISAPGQTPASSNSLPPVAANGAATYGQIGSFLQSSDLLNGAYTDTNFPVSYTNSYSSSNGFTLTGSASLYSAHNLQGSFSKPVAQGSKYDLMIQVLPGSSTPAGFGLDLDSGYFGSNAYINCSFTSTCYYVGGSVTNSSFTDQDWSGPSGITGERLFTIEGVATASGTPNFWLYELASLSFQTTHTYTWVDNIYKTFGVKAITLIGQNSLTTTDGSWTGGSGVFTYQAQESNASDCSTNAADTYTNLSGQTQNYYPVQVSDIGSCVRFAVTSSSGDGTTSNTAYSNPVLITGYAPFVKSPAIASGPTGQNTILTATNAGVIHSEGPGDTLTYAYQWNDNSVAITGATNQTFTNTTAVGDLVNVTETISNATGSITTKSVNVTTTPSPTLNALTLSNSAATSSLGYTSTINNTSVGSTLAITTNPNNSYSLNQSGNTWTLTAAVNAIPNGDRTDGVVVTETLAGSTNSGRSSTINVAVSHWGPYTLGSLVEWFSPGTSGTVTYGTAPYISQVTSRQNSLLLRTQGSTSVQPKYAASSYGACSSIRFASGQYMVGNSYDYAISNNYSGMTTVVVFAPSASNASGTFLYRSVNGSTRTRLGVGLSSGKIAIAASVKDADAGGTTVLAPSTTIAASTAHIVDVTYNGSASSAELSANLDGALETTYTTVSNGAFSNTNSSTIQMGVNNYGSPFAGDILAELTFNSVVSAADLQRVDAYFASSCGFMASLPSSNPYKATGVGP